MPETPPVPETSAETPANGPDDFTAAVLEDHPDLFDEPRSIRELRDTLDPPRSFDELFELREQSYRRNGLEPPPLSRESLNDFLSDVWNDESNPSTRDEIYKLYSAPIEENSISDPTAYMSGVDQIFPGRQGPGARLALNQGEGSYLYAPGDGRNPNDIYFLHFNRLDGGITSDEVGYRVYINAEGNSAPGLMRALVHEVLDRPTDYPGLYSAKIAGPGIIRSDNIVVYVKNLEHADLVTDWLRVYAENNPGALLPSAPPMTHQVMDGVGLGAEPPIDGTSFGYRRAQAISEALHITRENGGDFNEFVRNVDDRLRKLQLDPDDPYLNLSDDGPSSPGRPQTDDDTGIDNNTEEPESTEPPTEEPDTTQPPTEEPDTTQPPTEEPDTTQPPTEEPDTTQPPTEEPDTTQPPTEEPDTTQP
ncbi:T3SS effector HopA1 family protein, partial [Nocardia sp. NPDC051750]|uniref:T3SS effector HopA1 family protein n=1 Tax=Nocardia sp. NPDC051750 TaxID=3364325 RepID=UPI0037A412B2